MNERKRWKKELFDQKSRKNQKRKRKKKYRGYQGERKEQKIDYSRSLYQDVIIERYEVPENFSLTNNTNETVAYFNTVISGIKRKVYGQNFVIDSLSVTNVTVDALIYLIAIMENMKLNRSMKYVFSGTFPKDKASELVYKESGFMDYVTAKDKRIFLNKEKVRIKSGTHNVPGAAKEICDFVMSEFDVDKKKVLFISKILVELMSNAYHHAYPDDVSEEMFSKWYLYAERFGDRIKIIFADTGKGITGTVRKKWNEKLIEVFGGMKDDELLNYAFQPDNFLRTETNESHRGNGLPGIRDVVENSPINTFWVFSGKGGLQIHGDVGAKELTKYQFMHRIYGTIIVFEFNEGGLVNE